MTSRVDFMAHALRRIAVSDAQPEGMLNMNVSRLITNSLVVGGISSATSVVAALIGARRDVGKAASAMNAVSHIAWGGRPPAHEGPAGINTVTGLGLHTGACIFWASIFETVLGRFARRDAGHALLGGALTAATAYVTDYYVVSKRFQPGYERYLSRGSMFAVYAALAAGIAVAAMLTRLDHHQIENHDEGDERRNTE